MGLIIAGHDEDVPGLHCTNWREDENLRLKEGEDIGQRGGAWVRAIVLHTTSGLPKERGDPEQDVIPGVGPATNAAERINRFAWGTDHRCASAHLLVDHDGSVGQYADLQFEVTYHAGPVNERTVGIEIYQDPKTADLYAGQIAAVVQLVDWLTRRFGIQRQVPVSYSGAPIPRCANGGVDVVGVYGHRDVSPAKGRGDPGDAVFVALRQAGYEAYDLVTGSDLAIWQSRQRALGLGTIDGVPGPGTRAALERAGHKYGLWIARPGD